MRSLSLSMSRKHLSRNAHFFIRVLFFPFLLSLSLFQHTITHNDIKNTFYMLSHPLVFFFLFLPLFHHQCSFFFLFLYLIVRFYSFPVKSFSYRFVLGIISLSSVSFFFRFYFRGSDNF